MQDRPPVEKARWRAAVRRFATGGSHEVAGSEWIRRQFNLSI